MKRFLLFISLLLLALSCTEDPKVTHVHLTLEHKMNGEDLQIGETYQQFQNGNTFKLNKLKYYISHVKLINTGTRQEFSETDSYHLIEVAEGVNTYELDLSNMPEGTYDAIEFSIGVDSTHNHNTDQIGDLDPANEMVWNWKTGYKFLLLEGEVYDAQGGKKGLIQHVGTDANFKTITIPFEENVYPGLFVELEKPVYVTIEADMGGLFGNPNPIDLYEHNEIMMDPEMSGRLMNNFAENVFVIKEVKR